jgi:RNA polymerase sigma factor (sigma-70 family)
MTAADASRSQSSVAGTVERERYLTALVSAQLDFVWRLVRRLGLDRTLADDVTQEVFLVAVRRLGRLRPGHERAFLYGVALRATANARRRLRRQRELPEELLAEAPAGDILPDEAAERARRAASLDALLDEMPDELRRVLVLTDVLDLDVGEVAELERIPAGTVASRLCRARERFRKKVIRAGLRLPARGVRR